mmetsp:Transcript_24167/g.36728  ORF Transcript_24167/g.36728 Transcript_24167/m.36728 type:complete len:299 (+) Transcript_24167:97-993(+)
MNRNLKVKICHIHYVQNGILYRKVSTKTTDRYTSSDQNKKNLWANGIFSTGSHHSRLPSATTSNVSGSTLTSGVASFLTMSAFVTFLVSTTAATSFPSPNRPSTSSLAARPLTNATDVPPPSPATRGRAPNMGRIITGWGVGMLAFGSPIWAQAMVPPLMTISGLAPNMEGFHKTRSASLEGSIEPTRRDMPWATAGLMVYLAMYRRMRSLSSSPSSPDDDAAFAAAASSSRGPSCRFILSAVCQVRVMTSPTRPMAWESLDIIDSAPRSCMMSSAAIVSGRILDSANATSSGMAGSR